MLSAGIVAMFAIPYAVILLGLTLTVISDTYISKTQKKLMLAVLILTAVLIVQNVADYYLKDDMRIMLHRIVGVVGYSVRPAIIVLFCSVLDNSKKRIIPWIAVAINAAVYLTAVYETKLISFNYSTIDFTFKRGPLGYSCHIVSGLLIVYLCFSCILKFVNSKKEIILPLVSIILIIGAIFADTFLPVTDTFPVSILTTTIIVSCIFFFLWIHMHLVYEHETEVKTEQRIKIMISQIQPHFLFNTIATFRALCKRDPDKAAVVAENFAQYLRQNLNSLNSENLIPFEKEIEHTKLYADIEMVRFENVRIEYDIKDTDFYIPPLTVQPIVENAIRHGVRIKKDGMISVSTEYSDHSHKIIIRDNGIGFDINEIDNFGEKHIGIKNVKERIEKLCGGTMIIESAENSGTTVTICIPEKAAKK